jgi:hemolysin activation/secretion protein
VDSKSLRRDRVDLEIVKSSAGGLVGYMRIAAGELRGSGIIPQELLRVGGAGTVRGFPEEYLSVRGAVWGAVELRWRPEDDAYLGVFLDAGYLSHLDPRIQVGQRGLTSFGVTSQMETRAGRLGLDLALARGEPLLNARIHARMEGWF